MNRERAHNSGHCGKYMNFCESVKDATPFVRVHGARVPCAMGDREATIPTSQQPPRPAALCLYII
jgi:hypothetical protein